MYKWPAILFLILLIGCAGGLAVPAAPTPMPIPGPLRERAEEFKHLRTVPGHFSGGAWNDDVDQWMGRKHQLMIELGDTLGGGAYSKTQAVDLLGAPDAVARQGDALYDQIRDRGEFKEPGGGAYKFLVYYWRGERDFLYLVMREEMVLGAGWWYAGE
jgi:hypothetical protein